MQLITKSEAKDKGLPRYYTGKPCKRNHYSERYIGGDCVECIRLQSSKWRSENPERKLYLDRLWKKENNERHLENSRRWSRENKAKKADMDKQWYLKNKQSRSEYTASWYKENKDRVLYTVGRWKANQRAINPEYRLREAMGNMVRRVLSAKTERTSIYLGYSTTDLREHLERQFTKGMSWDNYGEWHIDHIYPVSLFISDGETDPSKINCLSNLRPLWAKENLSKGAKQEVLI